MNPSPHIAEPDLILYQLQDREQTSAEAEAIRLHLESCHPCADLAASIAETLRVFSASPVPAPDLDHAWQTLRPHLLPLSAAPSRPLAYLRRSMPLVGLAVAALLLLAVFLTNFRPGAHPAAPLIATARPGPLTEHPVDPALSAHLESAERFLTEVSHTSTPLDPATRAQAQALLLHNALYVQTARQQGDLADAALLEKLGRVLTSVDHEPPAENATGWHVRLELNTNGLLLDLRILRQNEAAALPPSSQPHQDTLQ